MPLYEYECNECACRFEHTNTIAGRNNIVCPRCGSSARLLVSLSNFRMEEPATIRYADGRIFDQKPRGGAVAPPRLPTPEQRDKEIALQRKEV